MNIKIDNLNKTILKCKKCPRLVNFIKKISTEKRKQNINETYWGKPVTGFGAIDAKILIIGLAPACLLYTSPSPRDRSVSRMPSSA